MRRSRPTTSKLLSKADLTAALRHLHDGIRAEVRQAAREIVTYVRGSQTAQDAWSKQAFLELNTKLNAIMEEPPVTRREVQNLLRELKSQGIRLDESRIFARS